MQTNYSKDVYVQICNITELSDKIIKIELSSKSFVSKYFFNSVSLLISYFDIDMVLMLLIEEIKIIIDLKIFIYKK